MSSMRDELSMLVAWNQQGRSQQNQFVVSLLMLPIQTD